MAISFWRGKKPKTTHEAEAQKRLVDDLKRLYSADDEPVVVVFDVFIPPNADIDMLVLKRDALIVVEMKRCEKAVRGGVNGAWEIVDGRVPPAELKGGSFGNPFLQIQEYYYNFREYLEDRKGRFLEEQPASQICFRDASAARIEGIIAIDPEIHPDSDLSDVKKRWLRISGLNQLAEKIYNTHSGHGFSEEELTKLVRDVMRCKLDQFQLGALPLETSAQPSSRTATAPHDETPAEVTPAELWAFLSGGSVPEAGPVKAEIRPIRPNDSGVATGFRASGVAVTAVAVSADGRRAICASSSRLKIWDVETCTEPRTLYGHTSTIFGVALSADGRRAVTASGDKTLMVWNVDSGAVMLTLSGHSEAVYGVAVSRDGRLAVSASCDRTLKVWDLDTGTEIHTLACHSSWVRNVAINPDAALAVSTSIDALKVWNLQSGKELSTITGHPKGVYGVALGGGGRWAVSGSGDGALRIWNLETRAMLRKLRGHKNGFALSADGRWIVSGSNNHVWGVPNTIEVLDLATAKVAASLTCSHPIRSFAIAENRTIVAGDQKGNMHFLRLDIEPPG